MKIDSVELTTCSVAADGETMELGLVDRAGTAVCLRLPFEQAEAIVMTLPTLLADALKRRTGKKEARYVFGLGEWSIEDCTEHGWFIVTLKTTDGFAVSFAIPFEACQALGWTLKRDADEAIEAQERESSRPRALQ